MSKEKLIPKSVNQQDEYRNTALHYAALNRSTSWDKNIPDFEKIEELLSLSADITLQNHNGLTAGNLIFGDGDYAKKTGYLSDKDILSYVEYKHTYTNLVIKYQPTFKNICCLLESKVAHPTTIPVCELSQDCLENLIIWCQKGVKLYENRRIKNSVGYDISNVPKHLRHIDDVIALEKRCKKELEQLQKYAYLNTISLEKVLTKIIDPCYRDAIMTTLMQDKAIKSLFDAVMMQLDELPLSDELKENLQQLNKKLEKKIGKNHPQLICLNEEGKKLVDSLFQELYETFHVPNMELEIESDVKEVMTSTRWKNDEHDFFIECSEKYKPKHKQRYQPVLSQIVSPSSFFSCTSSTSSVSSSMLSNQNTTALGQSQPTSEEIRQKCAEDAEKRFSS